MPSAGGKPATARRFTDEVERLYAKMDCPVTVLWGRNDDWIPYETGKALAAILSDHPCIPIPNAGHLVQEDRPEALMAGILKRWS